jgi:hypothetical protein
VTPSPQESLLLTLLGRHPGNDCHALDLQPLGVVVGRRDERIAEPVEVHRQVGGSLVDLEEVEQDADRKLCRPGPGVAELEPGAGVGIARRER